MNILNRLTCSAVSHVIPSVDNFHTLLCLQLDSCCLFMVLLSFKFVMNFHLFYFLPIANNSVLYTSYFCIFLLVVVFVFFAPPFQQSLS